MDHIIRVQPRKNRAAVVEPEYVARCGVWVAVVAYEFVYILTGVECTDCLCPRALLQVHGIVDGGRIAP